MKDSPRIMKARKLGKKVSFIQLYKYDFPQDAGKTQWEVRLDNSYNTPENE